MPVLAFLVFAASMIFVLSLGQSMIWAMLAGFLAFLCAGLRRGFPLGSLLRMSAAGARNSLIVVRVMLVIGVLTGLWRSAGTFAFLTAWGLRLIAPNFFVLAAFLLSSVLSYAIGTSFGTAGTLGVTLMALAHGGGVDEIVTAGAVLSGIYFGDRCSPASSCAHLVAALTETDLYSNIRLMMRTALLPFLLSLGVYLFLSLENPMHRVDSAVLAAMETEFNLSLWAGLPALIMLLLPLMGVNVFTAFLASILCALF
ncbi:MAG: sodium:proton antiporter, partial [Fretibacterium sp.]|nr:sodium:proton antiporter [Fretibacterium sp.]